MRYAALCVFLLTAVFASCGGSDNEPSDANSTTGTERSTEDRTDEVTAPQVHLMYVLPSDGLDRNLDTNGTIETSFGADEKWLGAQSGGRSFRLDTYGGKPDISFLRLSRTDADVQSEGAFAREAIEGALKGAGFDKADTLYVVYYDGGSTYACGSGAYPPTIEGNTAVLFLQGTPLDGAIQCGSNQFAADVNSPGFWEFVAVHELMHTLGAVPDCAPNETMSGHISGPANDLMYEGEEETDLPKALDPGRDDYYGYDNAGCLDIEDSPYLTE